MPTWAVVLIVVIGVIVGGGGIAGCCLKKKNQAPVQTQKLPDSTPIGSPRNVPSATQVTEMTTKVENTVLIPGSDKPSQEIVQNVSADADDKTVHE